VRKTGVRGWNWVGRDGGEWGERRGRRWLGVGKKGGRMRGGRRAREGGGK